MENKVNIEVTTIPTLQTVLVSSNNKYLLTNNKNSYLLSCGNDMIINLKKM